MARWVHIASAMRWFVVVVPVVLVLGFGIDAISPKAQASSKSANCPNAPQAKSTKFRHKRSRVLANMGSARHRGNDLIASVSDENQTLTGKLAYTKTDKDLEDEDLEILACLDQKWTSLGTSTTNGDGRFSLTLSGAKRLPVGLTDLWIHVPGDGSGVRFLSFVAGENDSVIVTDIDGTITASENAIYKTLVLGEDIGHQAGAPEAFAQSGRQMIYVTSRGDQLTEVTREWLVSHGFPRGPVRLAKSLVTLPGTRTVTYKTHALDFNVPLAAGVGNRASDITAYKNAGLAADRIFINLPEFGAEVNSRLAAGEATAFDNYVDIASALRR